MAFLGIFLKEKHIIKTASMHYINYFNLLMPVTTDKLKLAGPWATFSNLDVDVLVHAMQLNLQQKQPILNMKTQFKQLLGYLPLAFVLPVVI